MISMTPEQAAESNIPFILFISFPSAKDPDWDTKYKGNRRASFLILRIFQLTSKD